MLKGYITLWIKAIEGMNRMIVNETLKVIKQRRSIRNFKDEQIKDEQLQAILEAGMYAPNAGKQPWHFTAVQNKDMLVRLNQAAKETAKGIEHLKEKAYDEEYDCLYGAPTLIIVSGNEQVPVPLEADCAAATQNMLLAAESLGLGSCWIYFVILAFDSPQGDQLRKELKIPDGYKPYYSAIIGYKQDETIHIPDRKPNMVTYIK
ncbi:nitroreductase family protein [Thermoactinomyces mirandus]|nr:nitroreductase [Thermoactinomyces mirandus]